MANIAKLAEAASLYSSYALGPISFTIPIANELGSNPTRVNDKASGEGDLTSGSETVENVTSGQFIKEAPISGTGIPAGTTIQAVKDKWNAPERTNDADAFGERDRNESWRHVDAGCLSGMRKRLARGNGEREQSGGPARLPVRIHRILGGNAQVAAVTKPDNALAVPGAGVSGAFVFVVFNTASPPPPFAAGPGR